MTTTSDVLPIVAPADHIPGPTQGQWTYADYAKIPDDGHRYEILDGVLYVAPSPYISHQSSVGRFCYYLFSHVQLAELGQVIISPFDVELSPKFIVQPDFIVVLKANLGIITPAKIVGAPDLVVEVSSPGIATYDRNSKLRAYAQAGISEYWIADPAALTVELLQLNQGTYRTVGVYQGKAVLPSQKVPNLPVQVEQFSA